MKRKIFTYESDALVVEYEVARCIHAAECVHGLPGVFDPKRRPWIDASAASADDIAKVIQACPTGALRYQRRDGVPGEPTAERNTARVASDGPVYLEGEIRLHLPNGEVLEENRVALCRCGASKNKPFCDNSHVEAGFTDPATRLESQLRPAQETPSNGTLNLRLAPNGPVLIDGPVTLSCEGQATSEGVKGALCRCGHSRNKPYCDGAHAKEGFEAE
ncbi:MAG: CDGSH iron-sulfur domain-containing protein [Deltaproteobacteria bacterium]|nr:CDGSH iron-sulfur domain-containing protein [Deltaproteobacteria bacterium]